MPRLVAYCLEHGAPVDKAAIRPREPVRPSHPPLPKPLPYRLPGAPAGPSHKRGDTPSSSPLESAHAMDCSSNLG